MMDVSMDEKVSAEVMFLHTDKEI